MGPFDEIRCLLPLPIVGANTLIYQTKSFPDPSQSFYKICADGTLWLEHFDIDYHLESAMWRINREWRPCPHTGEIVFYGSPDGTWGEGDRLSFCAYFVEGSMRYLVQLHRGKRPTVIIGEAAPYGK